ncbi:hypothetical protein BKA70DRAFT_305856 [Coprinopsis sp. MPI-PUGE-AT-0042]|nr:hypothetical protein BKA70DRAFT_248888 [Coprinopsis sp. MPI-PUGE-AT-0042]KAH6916596.1 hypothetical protein BKA70DRAFT_305856 [Coprinopsis sp. MPI-PUGE-AT-0042]
MVDTPVTQHAPAVKVGGRRMSAATRHKPQASVDKAEDASKPEGQAAKDGDDSDSDEVMRKRRREASDKQNHEHHFRKEQNRPTREAQSNFKAFAGQRIAQPAGKGLGV